MFSKKKSYAFSKARRGRSVSMSASPAPSVVGTSVGRPSVPPASPPPSRDQVVMGGQTSVGVSVGCLGSAPSGSITMATGYITDDVVAASPVPPPASGGEGGQEKLPPACSPIPGPSSTRLLSPGRREKRVDPSGSSHAGPPRSPSTERERGGKRCGKRSRSPSQYRSRSSSGERRGELRDIASGLESDVTATVTWSDLAALTPSPLLGGILNSVPAPTLTIFIASAPMIIETRVSTAHAILRNTPASVLGLGSAPTASELLRSEAIMQDAVVRAPHRFWERRRSDLASVPFAR